MDIKILVKKSTDYIVNDYCFKYLKYEDVYFLIECCLDRYKDECFHIIDHILKSHDKASIFHKSLYFYRTDKLYGYFPHNYFSVGECTEIEQIFQFLKRYRKPLTREIREYIVNQIRKYCIR